MQTDDRTVVRTDTHARQGKRTHVVRIWTSARTTVRRLNGRSHGRAGSRRLKIGRSSSKRTLQNTEHPPHKAPYQNFQLEIGSRFQIGNPHSFSRACCLLVTRRICDKELHDCQQPFQQIPIQSAFCTLAGERRLLNSAEFLADSQSRVAQV